MLPLPGARTLMQHPTQQGENEAARSLWYCHSTPCWTLTKILCSGHTCCSRGDQLSWVSAGSCN